MTDWLTESCPLMFLMFLIFFFSGSVLILMGLDPIRGEKSYVRASVGLTCMVIGFVSVVIAATLADTDTHKRDLLVNPTIKLVMKARGKC